MKPRLSSDIVVSMTLTLFWMGGANLPPPPAGFLNIAQKPLGLGT